MRPIPAFFALLLLPLYVLPLYALPLSPTNTRDLQNAEIWLASGDQCNSCDIFAEVRGKRDYGDTLSYKDGNRDSQLPIRNIDKAELSSEILEQLPGDQGPAGEHWDVMLTVLVVEDGEVLAFGNIAESADVASAGYRHAVMFPLEAPAEDDPALNLHNAYRDFFIGHWNLEYFVDQALSGEKKIDSRNRLHLSGDDPARISLAKNQLVLWGSAKTPYSNSLFISERIGEIRQRLAGLDPQLAKHTVTLYGHGPQQAGRDTSYLDGEQVKFKRAAVQADLGARLEDIDSLFAAIDEQRSEKTLLVQVGHSGVSGAPLWGRLSPLPPQSLKQAAADSGTELIMVSGACNSGRFADVGACGFFAAHPDALASGCQLSENAIRQSDDYLRLFFGALDSSGEADSDDSGTISFAEAHWYAASRVEDHNLPYTDIDALADTYFEQQPAGLPQQLSPSQAEKYLEFATDSERRAYRRMTGSLAEDSPIQLTELAERHTSVRKKLHDYAEAPSAERNELTDLPYKLALPALLRRLIYKSLNSGRTKLSEKLDCEETDIADFIRG